MDIVADVFLAEQFIESAFLEDFVYFRINSGQDDMHPFAMAHLAQVGQVMDTRRVDERNFRMRMMRTLGCSLVCSTTSSNRLAMPKK